MTPTEFLEKAATAARLAGHVFPEYAACETALESAWGSSALALHANNLFGQKQSHPPRGESLSLPTRECLHGAWLTVQAQWMVFSNWQDCFAQRMTLLRALEAGYPHYQAALGAQNGEQFVTQVSKSWSTDPERADKVLSVYRKHFAAPVLQQV
jgi:flagellum-specific peptidoglycan hydrolase FlgJ